MSWLSFLGPRENADAREAPDRRSGEPEPARPADASAGGEPAPASGSEAVEAVPTDGSVRLDEDDGPWNFDALVPAPTPPPSASSGTTLTADPLKTLELKPHVIEAISTVFDPEIPVNIYELGLIYDVIIDAEARVQVQMTLTSPACPAAQQLPGEVQDKVRKVPGVAAAAVEIVWDPPWSPERMSDVARLQLGFF